MTTWTLRFALVNLLPDVLRQHVTVQWRIDIHCGVLCRAKASTGLPRTLRTCQHEHITNCTVLRMKSAFARLTCARFCGTRLDYRKRMLADLVRRARSLRFCIFGQGASQAHPMVDIPVGLNGRRNV
jgi:hypothetical protein